MTAKGLSGASLSLNISIMLNCFLDLHFVQCGRKKNRYFSEAGALYFVGSPDYYIFTCHLVVKCMHCHYCGGATQSASV